MICEWNKLDLGIHKSTYSVIRQYLLKGIRPQPSATFNVVNLFFPCTAPIIMIFVKPSYELKSVDENILKLSGNKLINLLLYGDSKFDSNKNTRLLSAAIKYAIKYVIDSGRFTFFLTNIGMSLSSFLILFYFYYFFQNMTELFITLSSPVFIYLYLTQIQYNLCLIKRAE